jgi:hypothetical protein
MELSIDWGKLVSLKKDKAGSPGYTLDLDQITTRSGVYVFGRRRGSSGFEALYVGKATNIRSRVRGHQNNLRLMQHIYDAKNGKRVVLAGALVTKRGKARKAGQRLNKSMALAEKALIRHFLTAGDELVNKHGTRIRRHTVGSSGEYPKRFFPRNIYLERSKGE